MTADICHSSYWMLIPSEEIGSHKVMPHPGLSAPVATLPPVNDLELALILADAADAISNKRFLADDLKVDAKPDLSPVSDADKAVERTLRDILAGERPDDAIIGEEFSTPEQAAGGTGRRWVIDPIDGTKNYVRGVPVWGTLIGLFDGDEVITGVVSAPALFRRWWASRGEGAFTSVNGGEARRIHVSGVADAADASLSFSSLSGWEKLGKLDNFLDLTRCCWRVRGLGDFFSYMLVAEGAIDIATEPELNVWDVAALIPIITEAGGRITGIDGTSSAARAGNALATNGRLHAAATAALNG
jgi:histidinol-phosphatase